jgi:hypothetical protein
MLEARHTSRQIRCLGRQEIKRRLAEHLCDGASAQRGPRRSIRLYIKECNSNFPPNLPICSALLSCPKIKNLCRWQLFHVGINWILGHHVNLPNKNKNVTNCSNKDHNQSRITWRKNVCTGYSIDRIWNFCTNIKA